MVIDCRIPWSTPSRSLNYHTEDLENSARLAKHIKKFVKKDRYCGGIYLCAYSAFHASASEYLRDLVCRPLLEKGDLDVLSINIANSHINQFVSRSQLRWDWIGEIRLDFVQQNNRKTPTMFDDTFDFIARIKPEFEKSLLSDFLFAAWNRLPENELCDIDKL